MSLLLAPVYVDETPTAGTVASSDVDVSGGYLVNFFTIGNDGLLYERGGVLNHPPVVIGNWIDPQVGMNAYECRASALTIERAPGNYDSWLDLAASWTWGWDLRASTPTRDRSPSTIYGTDKEGQFDLEIRRKSDLVVVATLHVLIGVIGNA